MSHNILFFPCKPIINCLSFIVISGEGDNEGYQTAGPCKAPPDDVHNHTQPSTYAGRGRGLFRVRS